MLSQGHTRREGTLLSLSSNRIVMAWVHGRSSIINIRKEANILDADNLSHGLESRISAYALISAGVSSVYMRSGADSGKEAYVIHHTAPSHTPLRVTLLCCVHDHTPAAHTHLLSAVFTCSIALLTPCTSQCWHWAKLDGVTITLLIPAASLILLPNGICPHALSLISPFLPLSPPTFQFHLSALSLSPPSRHSK